MDRRQLPRVDEVVGALGEWPLPRSALVDAARAAIEEVRHGGVGDPVGIARERLESALSHRLQEVINATGVLLHTNLGRAPIAPEAAHAAFSASVGYGNVELDLARGGRGNRAAYLHRVLAEQTGAESALVVNNNAAALVLALAALANRREVVVSRGELIEIGGSYRLPEIIAAGGAELREVGTTNRTRISDYQKVIGPDTAVLLKVHPSNYRVGGFVEEASLDQIVSLAHQHDIAAVFDAGSGLLDEQVPWLQGAPPSWLNREPGIRQAVTAGADLVMFSGDKLLGGPQAGAIVGRSNLIERLHRHPLARAFRIDASTIASLSATIEMYADGRGGEVPVWQMASASYRALETRADSVLQASRVPGLVEEGSSVMGGGSVPGTRIPSPVIVIETDVDRVFATLLKQSPPVLGRRDGGRLILDLRTVPAEHDGALADALRRACQ